jgi:outer membrane protein OmpA-like peptidoglycan-associated protein
VSAAQAQQNTFYLDRLTVGGAPEDGIAVWRPVTAPKSRFFAQMGLGLSIDPLLMRTVAPNPNIIRTYNKAPVGAQVIDYMTVGAELADRVQFLATLPVALFETGSNPTPGGVRWSGDLQTVALQDLRLDVRMPFYRSETRRLLLGGGISIYAPTGSVYSYGGDGVAHTSLNLALETYIRDLIVDVNTGFHFRPAGGIGDLVVGSEWTFAVGAFYPLRDGKIRVGGELFGSTGLETLAGQSHVQQSTFFGAKNTPLEWMAEGRMALSQDRRLWAGAGIGTRLDLGYGAPDLRMMAMIGYWYPIQDSDANAPAARMRAIRARIAREGVDTDHDGIPDDIDLCPTEPEDKLEPDPSDGCPKAADRDNDGIPDAQDKCPDSPEDKDGIQDFDGCPEDDFDKDGVPDMTDACPREPGQPSKDPKINGCPQFIKRVVGTTEIQILKQIQFDTGKATIKANSFEILDEIVKLLKVNTDIKRLSIEGHTDDRGAVDMNNRLSQERSDSVLKYLTSHGIEAGRLEAHGFGPSRPIDSNETDAGRQKNRRVEFHINQQMSGGEKPASGGEKPASGEDEKVPDRP